MLSQQDVKCWQTVRDEQMGGCAVPPMSIAQAGCACVCRSKAWDAKIVTSAWWVHHYQVCFNRTERAEIQVGLESDGEGALIPKLWLSELAGGLERKLNGACRSQRQPRRASTCQPAASSSAGRRTFFPHSRSSWGCPSSFAWSAPVRQRDEGRTLQAMWAFT